VQTPGFSPLAKKTPAPEENFQLQQIRKNSKFSEISHFKVEASTIFVFYFNTSHEHFVVCMMHGIGCGRQQNTIFTCLWEAYAVSMRVFTFSSMSDSGLQHK
jgi:hypothetical protein